MDAMDNSLEEDLLIVWLAVGRVKNALLVCDIVVRFSARDDR